MMRANRESVSLKEACSKHMLRRHSRSFLTVSSTLHSCVKVPSVGVSRLVHLLTHDVDAHALWCSPNMLHTSCGDWPQEVAVCACPSIDLLAAKVGVEE